MCVPLLKNKKLTAYLPFAETAFKSELINQPSASFANKLKLFFQAPVLQASCHVITVAVTVGARAVTS